MIKREGTTIESIYEILDQIFDKMYWEKEMCAYVRMYAMYAMDIRRAASLPINFWQTQHHIL